LAIVKITASNTISRARNNSMREPIPFTAENMCGLRAMA
jgi:hypothetical protein